MKVVASPSSRTSKYDARQGWRTRNWTLRFATVTASSHGTHLLGTPPRRRRACQVTRCVSETCSSFLSPRGRDARGRRPARARETGRTKATTGTRPPRAKRYEQASRENPSGCLSRAAGSEYSFETTEDLHPNVVFQKCEIEKIRARKLALALALARGVPNDVGHRSVSFGGGAKGLAQGSAARFLRQACDWV